MCLLCGGLVRIDRLVKQWSVITVAGLKRQYSPRLRTFYEI
jgi:hypothetical protein